VPQAVSVVVVMPVATVSVKVVMAVASFSDQRRRGACIFQRAVPGACSCTALRWAPRRGAALSVRAAVQL